MDDVIQRIINSESLAQRIIDEARQEKSSHESDMAEEIEAYRYKVYADVWERINEFVEEQKKNTSDKVRAIEESALERIAEMKNSAELHRAGWVEHMCAKILE